MFLGQARGAYGFGDSRVLTANGHKRDWRRRNWHCRYAVTILRLCDMCGSFAGRAPRTGEALRDAVSREAQGGWKPPKKRRDPIEVLVASNEGRMPELVPIRFGRMLQSPFTFYRGSAAIMAADLASTPNSGLRVQACGDAHLLNFGGFATPERQVVFDVNDLDETLPAPWEWDLKRLTASIVIAAHICACTKARPHGRRRRRCAPTASGWPTIRRCVRSTSGTTRSPS
jgi:hypothetical protein